MRRTRWARPPAIELHIRHMPGGKFTDHVFGAMKEKDILRMEGPFGSFFLREDSDQADGAAGQRHRLCADQGADRAAAAQGQHAPGRAVLGLPPPADLYRTPGARRRSGRHALAALRAGAVSSLHPEDAWTGRTGFVHQAVMADWPDLSGHQVYACGAPVMVDAARRDFTARCGLPADEFFADAFTSEADKHGKETTP
jgi:CDP-4-dehydro-6-deoxyglucose reductase